MLTPQEIYEHYRIARNLQAHQLRVAAVAALICRKMRTPLNEHSVVTAALFHDMGNIIKSDLTYFPQFVEPEGLAYWQGVKDEFIQKYGLDEHEATLAIGQELGLSEQTLTLISAIGFSKMTHIYREGSFELQVLEYADMRVGPYGVTSSDERLEEGRKRYAAQSDSKSFAISYEENVQALRMIEEKIFRNCSIHPEDITDESCASIIDELRTRPAA